MRALAPVLLLALAAAAQPPVIPDFVRMKKFKDDIASRIAQLKADEEYASKPDQEKMLLAFEKGEKTFGKLRLTGVLVVETCLMKWADVQQADPTEAAKRVLAKLPLVLWERYGKVVDVPKDRKDMSKDLLDALDSEFLHVRSAAFESLKKIYRTEVGFMYVPDMNKAERKGPIENWRKFVRKQK